MVYEDRIYDETDRSALIRLAREAFFFPNPIALSSLDELLSLIRIRKENSVDI